MWPEDEILRRRRATAPRQPWDERLPDGTPAIAAGMRGPIAQLLANQPTLARPNQPTLATIGEPPPMALNLPMPPGPTGPVPTAVPPVRIGEQVRPNASTLQRLLAERQALSTADPSSKVQRTDWGYEQLPPEASPSRSANLGRGAGVGAMIAGQATQGDPWGTLAGTVVGALTGGISPSLIQAFQRRAELDRNAGELSTEQKLQLQNAQIGETMAQAEQRRLEPFLKAEELRAQNERFEATERGRNERAALSSRTRSETAAKANELRQKSFEETARHNRAMEARPTGSDEKIVNNAIYRKDKDGVYRLAPGSPTPISPSELSRAEREGVRATERVEKGRQAQALYQKGAEYWDQAKAKREEARRLGLGPDGQPSRVAAMRNEDAINRLTREAEKLEEKTRDVQVRGDLLAAESESGAAQPATEPAGGKGRAFDLRRWKADHPGADPSEVIKRAQAAGLRIIE